VELVPFDQTHFAVLASWFASEADIVQWGGPLLHYPLDDAQMQAMLEEGKTDPPHRLCWMAEHVGYWIGHVQLAFDWRNGNATLGRVAVNPAMRGKGLAVPMLRLAMDNAFAYPQILRLELNVYTFNQPAISTYNKLGFILEGTRRYCTQVGDERWDAAIMALLRNEYQLVI
jgi:RimJ/RimL family protein N-acetyltransferase